jgi:F-type H+-transporting ATPase subunit delta
MNRRNVALKYAKALYRVKKNFEADFSYLFMLFRNHPKFLKLLQSPLVTYQEKEAFLKKTLKSVVDAYFLRFVCYVTKKRRTHSLEDIFVEYEILTNSAEGSWKSELITSIELQPNTKKKLIDKMELFYNNKIDCKEKVDPKILGGTLLILGNKQIDWSIKNRLQKLKTHLLGIDICR